MSKFDDLFYTLMEEVTTEIVPTSDGEENAEENPEDGTEMLKQMEKSLFRQKNNKK